MSADSNPDAVTVMHEYGCDLRPDCVCERRVRLPAPTADPVDRTTFAGIDLTEPGTSPVDSLARVLMAAWVKADPMSAVVEYPASYVATFVDMARAVIALRPAPTADPVDKDQLIHDLALDLADARMEAYAAITCAEGLELENAKLKEEIARLRGSLGHSINCTGKDEK